MTPLFQTALGFSAGIAILILLLRIEVLLVRSERRAPAVFAADKILEYKLIALKYLADEVLTPLTSGVAILLVNAAGGGLLQLRADGWWYLPSVAAAFVAFDFYSYVVHRAQHKFAPLWAMHSLHHSAERLSATTGGRHFWLEQSLSALLYAPIFAIVLRAPAEVMLPVLILHMFNGALTHFDLRFSLGRGALWFNNPQYHRIHHSSLPQHQDKNFANFLPVFDMIFGTAWVPAEGEFPPVGLGANEEPVTVLQGIAWPLRHLLHRQSVGKDGAIGENGSIFP